MFNTPQIVFDSVLKSCRYYWKTLYAFHVFQQVADMTAKQFGKKLQNDWGMNNLYLFAEIKF